MDAWIAVAIGVLVLVPTVLAYGGWWAGWALRGSPSTFLAMVPGAGLACVLAGLGLAIGGPLRTLCYAAAAVAVLAGFVLMFAAPGWLGPRWYREARAASGLEQIPADLVPGRAERARRPFGRQGERPRDGPPR